MGDADDDMIDLDGLEVHRRLLARPGSPLPTTWAGQPLRVDVGHELEDGGAALPRVGWRLLTGSGPDLVDDSKWGTVLAAPVDDFSGRWVLMHLDKQKDGTWRAWVPWSTSPRPSEATRRRGLRLSWPDAPIVVTRTGLLDLTVRLGREDGGPLTWDEQDGLDVVGWLRDAVTREPLPFQPWQAFVHVGNGPDPAVRSLKLPIRWITHDVGGLAAGCYFLSATLASLNVKAPEVGLTLVDG